MNRNKWVAVFMTVIAGGMLAAWILGYRLPSMAKAEPRREVVPVANKPATDYRATPKGKLAAAKRYVDDFLVQDANPQEVFGIRTPQFPVWKDQPIQDCLVGGVVRWIEAREPYFESKKQDVVVVPVWAELLMIDVEGDDMGWGQGKDETGKSLCRWEYERYNPETKQFERLPEFRTRSYVQEFSAWGESMDHSRSEYWIEHDIPPSRTVAIDPDKRIVRYFVRVSVKRDQPYRLFPQLPRHWYAKDAITKLSYVVNEERVNLAAGVSDRDSGATGKELEHDLNSMQIQLNNNTWAIDKLNNALQQPEIRPPYPAGAVLSNMADTR